MCTHTRNFSHNQLAFIMFKNVPGHNSKAKKFVLTQKQGTDRYRATSIHGYTDKVIICFHSSGHCDYWQVPLAKNSSIYPICKFTLYSSTIPQHSESIKDRTLHCQLFTQNKISGYLFGNNAKLSISHSMLDKSPSCIISSISTSDYHKPGILKKQSFVFKKRSPQAQIDHRHMNEGSYWEDQNDYSRFSLAKEEAETENLLQKLAEAIEEGWEIRFTEVDWVLQW